MNALDIEEVMAAVADRNKALSDGSLAQIRRWAEPFLTYCAEVGDRPTSADTGLLGRYERAHPERFGKSAAAVRSQLRKVLAACDELAPSPAGRTDTFASHADALRGRAKAALKEVVDAKPSKNRQRQVRCVVGRVVVFLAERGIKPEDAYEGDLMAYRTARKRDGAAAVTSEVSLARDWLRAMGIVTRPKGPSSPHKRTPRRRANDR